MYLVKSAAILAMLGIQPKKHRVILTKPPKKGKVGKDEPIIILGQGDYEKRIYG